MFRRDSLDGLNAKLETVDAEIAAHPLSSTAVKEAHAIIEAKGEKDTAAVERELAERNLPSLEDLGRIQVKTTASWWRLYRDRKKLVHKIEKSGPARAS
jgi:hypothetical protein